MKYFSGIRRNRGNVVAEIFKVIFRLKKSRETSELLNTWSGLSSEHKPENYGLNQSAWFQSVVRVSIYM
jgi:hypothetical protein